MVDTTSHSYLKTGRVVSQQFVGKKTRTYRRPRDPFPRAAIERHPRWPSLRHLRLTTGLDYYEPHGDDHFRPPSEGQSGLDNVCMPYHWAGRPASATS